MEESQKMEMEFNSIMNELEQRRTNKNTDWYQQQLHSDYAQMRKNLPASTTQSLVTKKSQNLVDQRDEKHYQAELAYAESLRVGGSQPLMKKHLKMDQKMAKLAQRNPLDFIDAVLAHHPTNNWSDGLEKLILVQNQLDMVWDGGRALSR